LAAGLRLQNGCPFGKCCLAAISSLYKHLVRHAQAKRNPIGEVERPAINRDEGLTLAFVKAQGARCATRHLRIPSPGCAIARSSLLSCRSGCAAPRSPRSRLGTCTKTAASIRRAYRAKGGRRDALAINPQTAARLRVYLEASGHGADIDEPLFRPLKNNDKRQEERRGMDPDAIGSALRKYTGAIPGFYAVRMSL